MTTEQLDELERLEKAATQAKANGARVNYVHVTPNGLIATKDTEAIIRCMERAANALPALIAEVRRLREERTRDHVEAVDAIYAAITQEDIDRVFHPEDIAPEDAATEAALDEAGVLQ